MTAFVSHFAYEFRTGIRNRQLLLMNYLFPLGFFLMMGFVMGGINPDFVETMAPAMVIFAILAATLLGIPDPLVTARESGIFRSYKINGVPSLSILALPALTTLLHLTIVSAIVTAGAVLLFDAPGPANWLGYVLVFFAAAFAMAGIAVLIGVVAPSSRATVLYSQLFFIPSILLGGMMFPFAMLPEVAGTLARLLPATLAMNAFQAIAMGRAADFSPWGSVVILFVAGLLAFGLALLLFSWDSRNTDRRGHPMLAVLVLAPFAIGVLAN
jgi:ABC-2 type transport system permease protein